jgi:hypothetical protein
VKVGCQTAKSEIKGTQTRWMVVRFILGDASVPCDWEYGDLAETA